MKRFFKRVTAFTAALVYLSVSSLCTFAAFSPTYSGRFVATVDTYMTVSSSDAVMTKVNHAIVPSLNRFLTINEPKAFVFSNEKFSASYDHQGILTTLDGELIGYLSPPITVLSTDIDVTTNFLGFVTGVCINYNDLQYFKE